MALVSFFGSTKLLKYFFTSSVEGPSNGRIETFVRRSSNNRQMMEVSETKGKKPSQKYKNFGNF